MNLDTVRAKTIFTPFLDHTNQPTLSVTYPVWEGLQAKYASQNQLRRGSLETRLNYPCFQVYIPRSRPPPKDLVHGQTHVESTILEFIADLERTRFFQAFQGVRLEVHYGRAEFAKYLRSGSISRRVAEGICNHALQEREDRNTFECFKTALAKYSNSKVRRQYTQSKEQGASPVQLKEMLNEHRQLINNICDIGSLISPGIARFEVERKMYLHGLLANQEQSSKSEFDRSSTACSGLDPDAIRSRSHSMTKTLEELVQLELKKVRIPITPTSFYSSGPDEQPWHNVIIVLHSEDMHTNGLHIIKFGKDIPAGMELDKNLFMAGELDYKVLSVSFGNRTRTNRSTPHFGVILGWHLYALGLTKPSFLEGHTKPYLDTDAHVDARAQLTETKQGMDVSDGDMVSTQYRSEEGDVLMSAEDAATDQQEHEEEANEEPEKNGECKVRINVDMENKSMADFAVPWMIEC